jgi:SNF2 family DNA or RNA helicase
MNSVSISRPNKALILPPELQWPREKLGNLPDGSTVLEHDVGNTLMLRAAGYDVPNPMELYYDWPGGPPFAVQKKSAQMLVENRRAYLLNQQGTGKTKTALWAWDYLNRSGAAGKLLVVAKLSTLNFVWASEAGRTLLDRKVVVLGSDRGMSKKKRLELLAQEADIYIINHDGLKVIHDDLYARSDIDILILDELAVYRNNSDRSKGMRGFAGRFQRAWGLTGAPMPNEVTDVWSQCKILTPHTVPKFFKACRESLMYRIDQFNWRPKPEARERAFAMMQPSLRYSLEDVQELPNLIHRDVTCPLSKEQEKFYTEFRAKLAILVAEHKITAANAGAALNKLLQISGGWVYSVAPDFIKLDASPRLNLLRDLIEENERKVLIFAPYRHMVAGIGEFLNSKEGLGADSTAVIGDKGRDQLLFDFQDTPKYKALVSHPGPIGHGNTLTSADLIIWYSPIADYDVFDQANYRIRRIGQAFKQQILFMHATVAERRLYSILRRKENVQNSFLDLVEEASRGSD